MTNKNKVIVIGDSHVRAFSFQKKYIPFFIGPAAFNNFLTAESAEKLKLKIQGLFKFSTEPYTVMFLFSGDVEHTIRKRKSVNEEDVKEIRECAERYTAVVDSIRENLPNLNLKISAVLPGGNPDYYLLQEEYNQVLSAYCLKQGISFINVNEQITDSTGFLTYPYKADFAHISYYAVKFYTKELVKEGTLTEEEWSYHSDYRWNYVFDIETENGPFKIWGDIYKDQLIINDYQKLPLANLLKYSSDLHDFIREFTLKINEVAAINKIVVVNAGEGSAPFAVKKVVSGQVIGFENDPFKLNNARILNSLLDSTSKVELQNLDLADLEFPESTVIIDLEQYTFKENVRKDLLLEINKTTKFLLLVSENTTSDFRLLKKVGFSNACVCKKFYGSGKSMILAVKDDNFPLGEYDVERIGRLHSLASSVLNKFKRK